MNALVFAFFAVVAIAAAAPPSPIEKPIEKPHQEPIAIINQESDSNPDGSYMSKYETANGITQIEEGSVKTEGKETFHVARGISSYTSPDGTPIKTEWYADDTGYHASGAHLPVAPEVPAPIARALEWSIAHPYVEEEEEAEKFAKKITAAKP